jgi:hypothetical protein
MPLLLGPLRSTHIQLSKNKTSSVTDTCNIIFLKCQGKNCYTLFFYILILTYCIEVGAGIA